MSEPVGLGQVGLTVLRHWVLVTAGVLIGAAGAFGLTQVVPETYTATSVQLVKGVPGSGVAANYEAAQYAVNRSKSYPAFIGSLQVLEGVRDDLGDTETVDQLRLDLTATNPTDTPLIRITATGRTAADAQTKANSAARHLSRFITQIEMVSGRSPVLVETAVQAGLPQEPSSPQTKLYAAVGAALGLALTIAIALIRDYMPLARSSSRRRRRAVGSDESPPDQKAGAAPPDTHVGGDAARPVTSDSTETTDSAGSTAPAGTTEKAEKAEKAETTERAEIAETTDSSDAVPVEVADASARPGPGVPPGAPQLDVTDPDRIVLAPSAADAERPGPDTTPTGAGPENLESREPWQWLTTDILEERLAARQHGGRVRDPASDPAGDSADAADDVVIDADIDDDDVTPRRWRSASSSSRRG